MILRNVFAAHLRFAWTAALAIAGCGSRTGIDFGPGGSTDAGREESGSGCGGTGVITLVTRDRSTWFGSSLVVDGNDLYWLEHGDLMDGPGRLMRMRTCGGEPAQVAPTANYPGSLVIDDAQAYWTGWDPSTQIGSLATAPLSGGMLSTLASSYRADSLAVSGGNVYWADDESVDRTSRSGGSVATLASGQFPQGLLADATSLVWTNSAARGWWVAVMPLAGGAVTTLASGTSGNLGFSDAIALDGAHVYFTAFAPGYGGVGAVLGVARTGGAVSTLASGIHPTGLVLDGTNLYWGQGSDVGTGEIVRLATSGGTPVTLATGMQDVPQVLAVDSTRVYWISGSNIMAVGK
jgi:hypothetical protein